jgi:hypothetical protein
MARKLREWKVFETIPNPDDRKRYSLFGSHATVLMERLCIPGRHNTLG